MKSQITKIVSLLVCVCLIVSGMILSTSADSNVVTYTASSYSNPSSTGVANATKTFNDGIITFGAYGGGSSGSVAFRSDEIRVYQGAYATMTSTQDITSVTFNIKGKSATTVNISTSTDGSSWTVVRSAASLTTSFADVTVNFDPATKYIKLSDASKQIIIKSIKVTYAAAGGNQGGDGDDNTGAGGTTPTPTPSTPFDPTNKTPAEIMTAAKALTGSETIDNVTLTGTIKTIDSAYSSQYKNIVVTIDVEGTTDSLKCYRLTADDADIDTLAGLAIGDKITVNGTIGVYSNAPQFTQGCKMTACVKGGNTAPVAPTDPKEIVDAAYALAEGSELPYVATLTGVVASVDTPYDDGYKNITVTIKVDGKEDKPIVCFRLKAGEGADASTLAAGDKITVTGNLKNHYGTIEFVNSTYVVAPAGDNNQGGGAGNDNQGGNTDDNQGGNTNTGAGTNTGANTNTNTNTNAGSTTTTTPAPEKSPETGDSIALYIVMMAISAAAMVLVAKKRFA